MNKSFEQAIASAQNGDKLSVERLVEENMGLIWSIAKRFFGRGVEADDLFQLGCVGFLKAIEGFDLSYGTEFSTYAVPKIAGEIRRFLRDDGQVKVSRSLKERAYTIKNAREEYLHAFMREPTVSELSEKLGLTAEEIASAETASASAQSISEQTGPDGFCLENVLCTDSMEERIVENLALKEALSHLTERERLVIDLRYFRGITQQKAAVIVGVSQVQISRIEKKALSELRKYF